MNYSQRGNSHHPLDAARVMARMALLPRGKFGMRNHGRNRPVYSLRYLITVVITAHLWFATCYIARRNARALSHSDSVWFMRPLYEFSWVVEILSWCRSVWTASPIAISVSFQPEVYFSVFSKHRITKRGTLQQPHIHVRARESGW